MRIAIDCRMSGYSGIGVYLDNILAFLLSENTDDEYVLFGDKSMLSCYEKLPNCRIVHTKAPIFSFREVIGFPSNEVNHCDVFYSPNFNLPFGIKVPIYSTIHDIVFLDVDHLTSRIGKFIRWVSLWRTIKISKVLFTVSEFSKSRIQFHFKNTPNIIVANSGINRELKAFVPSNRGPYDFSYILFIGNIKKHKGLEVLLDAYERAREKGFNERLVIVGDYENFKSADVSVINRIQNQNDYVIFTGKISNDRLYDIITFASLLVLPSVYEGFGLPPLEALYLGCNVLISDIPVFREIYAKLPVTYFKLNDVEDLMYKIIHYDMGMKPPSAIKAEIDELYSLNRTAQLILKQIKKLP